MKLLTFLFATGSLAAQLGTPIVKTPSLVARDGASVSSAIASISSEVGDLQTAVTGFSGTNSVSGLESASSDVLKAIQSGTSTVEASSDLTTDESLPLVGVVQSLSSQVNSTVEAVIAKKSDFVSAGVGPVVLSTLQSQLNATQEFSTALISKVPSALQSTAQGLAQPIIDALNSGIAAFSDQTGSTSTSAGASPSTESSSAGETSSAESSSTTPASTSTSVTVASTSSSHTSTAASTSSSQAAAASQVPLGGYAAAIVAAAAVVVL